VTAGVGGIDDDGK